MSRTLSHLNDITSLLLRTLHIIKLYINDKNDLKMIWDFIGTINHVRLYSDLAFMVTGGWPPTKRLLLELGY